MHVDVSGTFYTFSPRVGSVVPGLVNKKSEKHIGCLVHDTFNISLMGERTDQSVEVGDTIMIEVTKLFWGHRSLPVIQGRHISDSSRDTPGGKEEGDTEYDSGIDSTVNGAAHDHDIDNTLVEEKPIKKNKKRKREETSGDESALPEIKAEVIDNEDSSISSTKKKKKKRKKESQ